MSNAILARSLFGMQALTHSAGVSAMVDTSVLGEAMPPGSRIRSSTVPSAGVQRLVLVDDELIGGAMPS